MEECYYLNPNNCFSSSKSSSPSVRTPYANSSDRKHGKRNFDLEYESLGVKCKCDLPAPLQEAWREGTLDPGRRFFGCSRWKDPKNKCAFFLWADDEYTGRARDVIKELKLKLRKKDDDVHNAKVDYNFVDRKMLVLHEELSLLRKKNKEVTTMLKKKEKEAVFLKRLLAVFVVVFLFMFLFFFN